MFIELYCVALRILSRSVHFLSVLCKQFSVETDSREKENCGVSSVIVWTFLKTKMVHCVERGALNPTYSCAYKQASK